LVFFLLTMYLYSFIQLLAASLFIKFSVQCSVFMGNIVVLINVQMIVEIICFPCDSTHMLSIMSSYTQNQSLRAEHVGILQMDILHVISSVSTVVYSDNAV